MIDPWTPKDAVLKLRDDLTELVFTNNNRLVRAQRELAEATDRLEKSQTALQDTEKWLTSMGWLNKEEQNGQHVDKKRSLLEKPSPFHY